MADEEGQPFTHVAHDDLHGQRVALRLASHIGRVIPARSIALTQEA